MEALVARGTYARVGVVAVETGGTVQALGVHAVVHICGEKRRRKKFEPPARIKDETQSALIAASRERKGYKGQCPNIFAFFFLFFSRA